MQGSTLDERCTMAGHKTYAAKDKTEIRIEKNRWTPMEYFLMPRASLIERRNYRMEDEFCMVRIRIYFWSEQNGMPIGVL